MSATHATVSAPATSKAAALPGIAHVIAVPVRNRHHVDPVEAPRLARAGRIALNPRVEQHGLGAARAQLERRVAEPGQGEAAVQLWHGRRA